MFKEVVLRVWRASNSPDAIPSKLNPIESIEIMYQREMRIRDMVGLAPPGGIVTNLLLNNGASNIRNSHNQLNGTKSSILGVNDSVNASTNTLSLTGILRGSKNTNVNVNQTSVMNGTSENVLSSQNYPNGNIIGNRSSVSVSRLDQVPLGEQLHTPFNARELLWNSTPML